MNIKMIATLMISLCVSVMTMACTSSKTQADVSIDPLSITSDRYTDALNREAGCKLSATSLIAIDVLSDKVFTAISKGEINRANTLLGRMESSLSEAGC